MSTAPSFTGFPRATFSWFSGLEADNSKAYFAEHRDTYDSAVRGQIEELLELLADEVGDGRVKLFRQHRDTRFAADKSPYKTTTYGLIAGRESSLAPLYAQLSSSGLFAGSGYYVIAADQLARMRDAIVDERSGTALEALIEELHAGGVETFGEALKTAPRGYPRDHPRIRLLRHKALIAGARLPPSRGAISAKSAVEHLRGTWAACEPLNGWLDEHVGASTLPEPTRFRR